MHLFFYVCVCTWNQPKIYFLTSSIWLFFIIFLPNYGKFGKLSFHFYFKDLLAKKTKTNISPQKFLKIIAQCYIPDDTTVIFFEAASAIISKQTNALLSYNFNIILKVVFKSLCSSDKKVLASLRNNFVCTVHSLFHWGLKILKIVKHHHTYWRQE